MSALVSYLQRHAMYQKMKVIYHYCSHSEVITARAHRSSRNKATLAQAQDLNVF
jgi:hypothetical protein